MIPLTKYGQEAKTFVRGAIANSAHLALGSGKQGPMNHSRHDCNGRRQGQAPGWMGKCGEKTHWIRGVQG